jgi:phosphate starvation-inducible protein PhoH and related proteins
MNDASQPVSLTLVPADNKKLASICGPAEEHIQFIEHRLNVTIHRRANKFTLMGDKTATEQAARVLKYLYQISDKTEITKKQLHLAMSQNTTQSDIQPPKEIVLHTYKGKVRARSQNQANYLDNIFNHTINFGLGPAGTGKTFLAVACAVDALEKKLVQRLILVRPAVEAGESLGFLPGDLAQKVDPYLRPIYDALYELLGFETVERLLQKSIIEIAPLAYMRGRTLNDAFVILDEAQNTTIDQMKMFLTRIGFSSTVIITGDATQVDLAKNKRSGLSHASTLLRGIDNISFTEFTPKDVVRHPIVQNIIRAYEQDKKTHGH